MCNCAHPSLAACTACSLSFPRSLCFGLPACPGIAPELASSLQRILRVIQAANRHVKPPEIKKLWSQKPSGKRDPLKQPLTASNSLKEPVDTAPSKELMNLTQQPSDSLRTGPARLADHPLAQSVRVARTPVRRKAKRKNKGKGGRGGGERSDASTTAPGRALSPIRAVRPLSPTTLGSSTFRSFASMDGDSLAGSAMGRSAGSNGAAGTVMGGSGKRYLAVVDPPAVDEWWDEESQAAVVQLHATIAEMREKLRVMTGTVLLWLWLWQCVCVCVLQPRIAHESCSRHHALCFVTALKDLDEGVDALLLQVAMQLPLPTPIAIGMRRDRNNGQLRVKPWSRRRRDVVDAVEADFLRGVSPSGTVLLLPYDCFLRELALLPARTDASEKKSRMLVRERTRVAWAVAQVWAGAFRAGGFDRMYTLLGARASTLADELDKVKYPESALRVTDLVPHVHVTQKMVDLLEYWLAQAPVLAASLQQRLTSFDTRYSRSSIDPTATSSKRQPLGAVSDADRRGLKSLYDATSGSRPSSRGAAFTRAPRRGSKASMGGGGGVWGDAATTDDTAPMGGDSIAGLTWAEATDTKLGRHARRTRKRPSTSDSASAELAASRRRSRASTTRRRSGTSSASGLGATAVRLRRQEDEEAAEAEARRRRRVLVAGGEDPADQAAETLKTLQTRPYPCDIPGCSEAFSQRHTLVLHKRTHKLQDIANATGRAMLAATFPGTAALG